MQNFLASRVWNTVAFLLTIALNGMANGIPLNGQTTGEISAQYPSLFTPSGFTFSIWGLIYVSLCAFIIYQMLPSQRENKLISKISPFFKVSCVANAAWIIAWHYNSLFLSLAIMFGILLCLVAIYRSIDLSDIRGLHAFIFIRFPFSLYTGWITVATIANISAVQTGMGWDNVGIEDVIWTLIKLAVAGAIGTLLILKKEDFIFGFVIAWAAYGIVIKQSATPSISGAALMLTLLMLILATSELVRKSLSQHQ
jgi:hypothetical protein